MLELNRERGTSLVVVTHDMRLAAAHGARVRARGRPAGAARLELRFWGAACGVRGSGSSRSSATRSPAPASRGSPAPPSTPGIRPGTAAIPAGARSETSPVRDEAEVMRRHVQQHDAHAVGEVVDRHHGEGIGDQPRRPVHDRQVNPPGERGHDREQQVHRQWHEADRESRTEGVSDRPAVQRPQLRICETLTEQANEPVLPERVGSRDYSFQQPARHRN